MRFVRKEEAAVMATAGSSLDAADGHGHRTGNGNGHRNGNGNGHRNGNGNGNGHDWVAAQRALHDLVDGRLARTPQLTIIVPTRHEAGNVAELGRRIEAVMPDRRLEVLFVDDSDDDTPDAITHLRESSSRPVRLIHRMPEQRKDGLSGAVVEGLRQSRAAYACVMDGDLQHPPELIERMLSVAEAGSDLVVASRFRDNGDADTFTPLRAFTSWAARVAVRALFPRRLAPISDPMSGFFLVRRDALDVDALKPQGFKILLEVAARTPGLRIAEVPLHFGKRYAGTSKASLSQGGLYGRQLLALRFGALSGRFGRFGVVGATGLVVNTVLLALLADAFGLHYLVAAALATQGSTLWNYELTERWVFRDRAHRRSARTRIVAYFALNNTAMLLRFPVFVVLASGLGMHYLLANVASLLLFTVVRYTFADSWIWAGSAKRKTVPFRYLYDVHGIVTVASEVRLPELARFKCDALQRRPTIAVRIAKPKERGVDPTVPLTAAAAPERTVVYREDVGGVGFGCEIDMGGRIGALGNVRINASPLLRRSPHVLYTNVVEPVLRWTFVQHGYALVHAACIAVDDRAYLITAKTDTGKTTTCLKTLDSQDYGFVSDDLTLLAPDGRVLTYPKPLTISRHTLTAVRTPLLSWRQRAALVVQSRLHSRSGRQFALMLARTGLPMATMNAVTQMVVPPPKYHVDRLIPGVTLTQEARLAGMFVIQRGADEERVLAPREALDTLLANCDDAYGFPPYPIIEEFLHSRKGMDLKAVEAGIVASAMEGMPAVLLGSSTMNWYQLLPRWMDRPALLEPAEVLTGSP